MSLMYWREYRTQFHIAHTYGVSEATVCRTLVKIENVLIQSGQFHLPGKNALLHPDNDPDVVVLDATECAVERPKKTAPALQRQKEAPHAEKPGDRGQEQQEDNSDAHFLAARRMI